MTSKEDDSTATETLTVRLTTIDRFALDRLVEIRTSELAAEGIKVKAGTYVRGLVRREAMAKGLLDASGQPTAALRLPARVAAARTSKAKGPRELEPEEVRTALQRVLDAGTSQAEIARQAGINGGQLSRFRRGDSGFSPEKLRDLAAVLAKL
jgi:hypothetical protein